MLKRFAIQWHCCILSLLSDIKNRVIFMLFGPKMLQQAMAQHTQQLENYSRITHENIGDMTKGGYIKYFNNNFELKYGGIVVGFLQRGKPISTHQDNVLLSELVIVVKNTLGLQRINYLRHHIFFMNHRTTNDKLRTIFLKAIA